MPRYGEWDEGRRESGEDRRRREGGTLRRGPEEAPSREGQGAWRGRESPDAWRTGGWRDEDARHRETWREDWGGEGWRGREGSWRPVPQGGETWRGGEPDTWRGGEGEWRGREAGRREIDPPWVERGPGARARGESRGMYEWEDRGPLKWLGDKLRGDTRGRGPKGYKRADERIHEEVCERLARSGIDASEVEVKVEKGEVTLTGTVRERDDKWRLEDVADDVYGVDEVHNRLRVDRSMH